MIYFHSFDFFAMISNYCSIPQQISITAVVTGTTETVSLGSGGVVKPSCWGPVAPADRLGW